MATDEPKKRHRPPALPSDMGEMRTIMAADRTLMAWLRTSLSMLSFGFTIYKFLDAAVEKAPGVDPNSPQHIGMFLAAMGTLAMVMGTINYWVTLQDLNRVEEFRVGRPTLLMALIMSVCGVALFITIWRRMI